MAKETQIRTIAQAVIRRVLLETQSSPQTLSASLEAAYPFGTYHGSAYQIWLNEVRQSLANRKARGAAA